MTQHHLEPTSDVLHGTFNRDAQPNLTIDSGDQVRVRTVDCGWHLLEGPNGRPQRVLNRPAENAGHALCGPIAVRGAKPGMTLAIRVDELRLGTWGWTGAGGPRGHSPKLGTGDSRLDMFWTLDPDKLVGQNEQGHRVKLKPFLGVMGMPIDEPGLQSTTPPRFTGGNLDCKELGAGSTLYLPIAVEGGLLSVGDGHAVQGDGEVSGVAIESPMEWVDLTITLHPDMHLTMPRAHTPAGWLTFGFSRDLNEASLQALNGMLDLMMEQYGYTRQEALNLASLVVDLRITQIVNDVQGVHAVLPHGALER